jgi:hypothetical protein
MTQSTTAPTLTAYDRIKRIRDEHQAAKIHGILIDATTAAAMTTVHDKLNPKHHDSFEEMCEDKRKLLRVIDFCWKSVR